MKRHRLTWGEAQPVPSMGGFFKIRSGGEAHAHEARTIHLLQDACNLLEAQGWLADDAWVYTESETAPSTLGLPGNWRLHREKHTGQVHYALWQRG